MRVKEKTMSKEKEVSAIEAARRLGVGLDYVYSLLWTGKLQGRKVGKQWRISAEAIEARLKAKG
jgi:excisionase family DNA binding protein